MLGPKKELWQVPCLRTGWVLQNPRDACFHALFDDIHGGNHTLVTQDHFLHIFIIGVQASPWLVFVPNDTRTIPCRTKRHTGGSQHHRDNTASPDVLFQLLSHRQTHQVKNLTGIKFPLSCTKTKLATCFRDPSFAAEEVGHILVGHVAVT